MQISAEREREVVWRRAFVFGLYRGCLIFRKKKTYISLYSITTLSIYYYLLDGALLLVSIRARAGRGMRGVVRPELTLN